MKGYTSLIHSRKALGSNLARTLQKTLKVAPQRKSSFNLRPNSYSKFNSINFSTFRFIDHSYLNQRKKDDGIIVLSTGTNFKLSESGQFIINTVGKIYDKMNDGRKIDPLIFLKLNDSFTYTDQTETVILLYQIWPIVYLAIKDRDFAQFNEFFDILNLYINYGINLNQIKHLFYEYRVPSGLFDRVDLLHNKIYNYENNVTEIVSPIINEANSLNSSFFLHQSFKANDDYLDFYKKIIINNQHIKNVINKFESDDLIELNSESVSFYSTLFKLDKFYTDYSNYLKEINRRF